MNTESAPIHEDHEKLKTVSIERTPSGSISIQVSEEKVDDFYGVSMTLDQYLEDKGLFEVIPNEANHTIEVRPLNPIENISNEVFDEIEKQVNVFNQ